MKKRILFVLPSLQGGGAERVIVTLLKHLNRDIFELHLALVAKEGAYLSDVPDDIPIYDLGVKRVRYALFSMLKLIWKLKPDIVFSTLGHLNIALIMLKPLMPINTRIIVREAITVTQFIQYNSSPRIWTWFYRIFYKYADLIVCQSEDMKKDLVENFLVPEYKAIRIYNPVDFAAVSKLASSGQNPFSRCSSFPNIIAIGRLDFQKGYDRLLRAMPHLLKEYPNAKLWVLGEGKLELELRKLAKELGLTEHVEFVGFQKNPYLWLKHADLFVLASYYEGLPNVLLEAIACGCPICVFDHPGGTREVLNLLGLTDRLITDNKELYQYLDSHRFEGFDQLNNLFGIEKIVKQYESCFLDLISK